MCPLTHKVCQRDCQFWNEVDAECYLVTVMRKWLNA